MNRLPMSKAAAGLMRALLARAGEDRDRILLTEIQSTDWQSLTFVGERHRFRFSLSMRGAAELFERITGGIEEAEFKIAGQILADITVRAVSAESSDRRFDFIVDALTICE